MSGARNVDEPATRMLAPARSAGPAVSGPIPPSASMSGPATELRLALTRAVEALPERERLAVIEIHVRGRTYDEASEATGIPLGSLKRALRTGLARLREQLHAA